MAALGFPWRRLRATRGERGERCHRVVEVLGGAGRWWRYWLARGHAGLAVAVAGGGEGVGGERWRCQAQRGSMVAARDLIPSSDLPVLFFCPSTSLLSSQDDPSNFSFTPLVTYFLHGRVPP